MNIIYIMSKNLYYLEKVRELNCMTCGKFGTQTHHKTTSALGGKKSADTESISLCPECHHDLHFGVGVRKWEEKHGKQDDLVMKTRRLIFTNILQNCIYPHKEADRLGFSLEDIKEFVLTNQF